MALFKRPPAASSPAEPPPYPVFPDFAWNDPGTDTLATFTRDDARPRGERLAAALDRMKATRQDPERMLLAHSRAADLGGAHPEPLGELTALLEAGPLASADPLDRADGLAVLAYATVHAAWEVRGSGRAATVERDAWPVFHAMAEQADELGQQALELVPDHPCAAVTRMWSGMALGLQPAEWRHRFEVARRRRPTLYSAHTGMLQAMCRKWYGSHEAMFGFAREVAENAPPGDPVSAVLPYAHVEYWLDIEDDDEMKRARSEDATLVARVSDTWLSGPGGHDHPQVVEAHQLFGWFFVVTGDKARANLHLSRTGGRISSMPWDYYGSRNVHWYRVCLKGANVPLPG